MAEDLAEAANASAAQGMMGVSLPEFMDFKWVKGPFEWYTTSSSTCFGQSSQEVRCVAPFFVVFFVWGVPDKKTHPDDFHLLAILG